MEDMLYTFFLSHGWKLTLIALSGIFLLGILKSLNIFNKVPKEKKKYIYAAISAGFSIAASGIYLAVVGDFAWSTFGILSVGILGVNQAAYAVYETYGIRALFRKIGNIILKAINNKNGTGSTEQIEEGQTEQIDDLAENENSENYDEENEE